MANTAEQTQYDLELAALDTADTGPAKVGKSESGLEEGVIIFNLALNSIGIGALIASS